MKVLHYFKINSKNIGLKPLLSVSSLFAIATGILASVNIANAATLGELKISGTLDIQSLGEFIDTDDPLIPIGLDPNAPDDRRVPLTTFDFKDIGAVNNNGFGEFMIVEGNGEFDLVNPPPVAGGTIKDLPPFPSTGNPVSNFLDLAFEVDSGSELGLNLDFDLSEFTPIKYEDNDIGVTNSVGVKGTWKFKDINDNVIASKPGEGTISTNISYDAIPNVNDFAQYLSFLSVQGTVIEGITLSGDFVLIDSQSPEPVDPRSIPEPSSIISLVALSLATSIFIMGKKSKKNMG